MSSGERAPLCGYINKPSFSIVIIIFLSIIYNLYIIIHCIPGYILQSDTPPGPPYGTISGPPI
jgi:hypothetical protein